MASKMAIAVSLLFATSAWAQDKPDNRAQNTAAVSYSDETPLEILASDPAAVAVLNKDLPGLLSDAQYPMFKRMSLKSLQEASGGDLSKDDVSKTVADLQALPAR